MSLNVGKQAPNLATTQQLSQNLSPERSQLAKVLGATRHGLEVQIGGAAYHLRGPDELSGSRTLTLKLAGEQSSSAHTVKVVALDGRPLSEPIEATLANRTNVTAQPAASQAAGTVIQKGQIDVTVQPVTSDNENKPIGTALAMRLQTLAPLSKTSMSSAGRDVSSPAFPTGDAAPSVDVSARHQYRQQPSFGASSNPSNTLHHVGEASPLLQDVRVDASRSARTDPPLFSPPPTDDLPEKSPADLPRASESAAQATDRIVIDRGQIAHRRSATALGEAQPGPPADTGPNPPATREAVRQPTLERQPIAADAASGRQAGNVGMAPEKSQLRTLPADLRSTLDRRGTLDAIVTGRTTAGRLLISAAGQHFTIEQAIDLPPGAALQLTPLNGMPQFAPMDLRAFTDMAEPLAKLIRLLEELDKVDRHAPDTHRQPEPRGLPPADKHLTQRLLSLLTMAFEGLEGSPENIDIDKQDLAGAQQDTLRSLVRDLGGLASNALDEGWKGMVFPMGADASEAIYFYHRDQLRESNDESSDEPADKTESSRAVFDVSFSQLGRCQVDALCQSRRFDLLIRSERAFPRGDQRDMACLFLAACDIAGMHGEIGFEIGHFFEPPRSQVKSRDLRT